MTARTAVYDAARHRFSRGQKMAGTALALSVGAWALSDPVLAAQAFTALFLATSLLFLGLRSTACLVSMLSGPEASLPHIARQELPTISLLCPLYREAEGVNNLIRAIRALDYPKARLEVIILLEDDDTETAPAIREQLPALRLVLADGEGPRTKPRALNAGLRRASGELIGVYDAEDRPEPDQLRTVAAAFAANPRAACVQAHLNYYNRDDTLLTRMFCLEYSLHFDYMMPGLVRMGLPIPLGGTSNFIRREALLDIGGWDAFNVTEDADLGLRLAEAGYRIITIPSSTFEEATDSPRAWVKQRSRWLKGYLQTWLVHIRKPLALPNAVVLHAAIGAVVFNALCAPVFFAAFLFWLVTRSAALEPVFGGWLMLPCLALFVGGNFLHAWLLMMAPLRRGFSGATLAGPLLPVYWVLQSAAAYRALYSFVRTPHYWSKTDHSAGTDPARETVHA